MQKIFYAEIYIFKFYWSTVILLLHQQQHLPNQQHVAKFKYSYDYMRKIIFDFMDDKKTKKS